MAIDRVVREILDVEQPPAFRRRVLARLDEGASLQHGGFLGNPVASAFRRKVLWTGLPIAAATIVILALLLPRQAEQPKPASTVAAVQHPITAPQPNAPPAILTAPVTTASTTPAPRSSRPARQDRTIVAAGFEPAAPVDTYIEPLKQIVPIQMAPLDESTIAPASIAMRPLNTIPELQVVPLNPPDRRN